MTTDPAAHTFKLDEYIMHHVLNSHEWKMPFLSPINLPHPLSLHAVMMFLVVLSLVLLVTCCYDKKQRVPTGITNLLELVVCFIKDQIVVPSFGKEDGYKYTPLFCTFFVFILMLNLIGLVPIFASPTANICVTGPLAAIILGMMLFGTIIKNGLGGFVHALIPSGLPKVMVPFFFILEFALLFLKCFALMIRLFANMLAGHMVILSLLGLVVVIGYVALPAVFLAVGIYALEVLVAFLQAYIFTLLSAVFIGQMYHPEH